MSYDTPVGTLTYRDNEDNPVQVPVTLSHLDKRYSDKIIALEDTQNPRLAITECRALMGALTGLAIPLGGAIGQHWVDKIKRVGALL